jgi:ATP adenylyltransferase
MAPKKRVVDRRDEAVPAEGLRLWAPWRYEYLRSLGSRPNTCIFCIGELSPAAMREHLVLFENHDVLVMLNKYPYNNGHVLVASRSHVASPELLTRPVRAVLADAVAASIKFIRESLKPHGFNVGTNLGGVAGAGIPDHIHWHVVPRWPGDSNFTSVLASTRVLSQSLEDSYDQLRPIFKNLAAEIS